MIVYEATKQLFVEDVVQDRIEENIDRKFYEKMGYHTSQSERKAWNNSMQYMMKVLIDNNIPGNVGIAIEFKIPNTSKRVDFMVSGYGADSDPEMVIIELKQWETLNEVAGTDALVDTFTGGANRRVVHPSYQAWSYAQLIRDYNASVQDRRVKLSPCACLHNYIRHENDPIDAEQYEEYIKEAPAYTKGQLPELRNFIKKS